MKYLSWYDNGSGYFDCGGKTDVATDEEARRLHRKVAWSSEIRITHFGEDANDPGAVLAKSD